MISQNLNPSKKHFVCDLSNDMLSVCDIYDYDTIEQSIVNILSCSPFEFQFSDFGSLLPSVLFEGFNKNLGERLIDSIINDIKKFEDRIIIDEKNFSLIWDSGNNSLQITIPYFVIETGRSDVFNKAIAL